MDTDARKSDQPGALHTGGQLLPYIAQEFKQRLDLISHLVSNGDRVPVVNGAHGSGKSTLLDQLRRGAPAEWEVCKVAATPMLQSGGLFKALSECYSLQQRALENPQHLLRRFEDLNQAGRLPVLLVDDAEQLSVETLVDLLGLFNQARHDGVRFALVLFAAPPIEALLMQSGERLSVDPIQLMPLQPLDFRQTQALARHLWATLSPTGDELGSADLERVFAQSKGLPEGIRKQLELLAGLYSDGGNKAGASRIRLPQLFADVSAPAVIGGVILALLILLTLVYEDEINALFEGPADTAARVRGAVRPGAPIPLPLPPRPPQPAAPELEERPESPVTEASDSRVRVDVNRADVVEESARELAQTEQAPPPINLPQIVRAPEAGIASEDAQETLPVAQPPLETPAEKVTLPLEPVDEPEQGGAVTALDPPPAAVRQRPAPASGASSQGGAGAPVVEKAAAPPPTERTPRPESVAAATPPAAQQPAPVVERSRRAPEQESKVAPVVVAAKRSAARPAPVTAESTTIRSTRWLQQQAPEKYTLQLLAVSSEAAAVGYIERHRLQDRAAFFRIERNGKALYPILYGVYPSRDAAVAAGAGISPDLGSRGVWARSFASIQAAIE